MVVRFGRDQVWQVCAEAIPQVQAQLEIRGVSFGSCSYETDNPPEC